MTMENTDVNSMQSEHSLQTVEPGAAAAITKVQTYKEPHQPVMTIPSTRKDQTSLQDSTLDSFGIGMHDRQSSCTFSTTSLSSSLSMSPSPLELMHVAAMTAASANTEDGLVHRDSDEPLFPALDDTETHDRDHDGEQPRHNSEFHDNSQINSVGFPSYQSNGKMEVDLAISEEVEEEEVVHEQQVYHPQQNSLAVSTSTSAYKSDIASQFYIDTTPASDGVPVLPSPSSAVEDTVKMGMGNTSAEQPSSTKTETLEVSKDLNGSVDHQPTSHKRSRSDSISPTRTVRTQPASDSTDILIPAAIDSNTISMTGSDLDSLSNPLPSYSSRSNPVVAKPTASLSEFHPTHTVTFTPLPGVISKMPPNSRLFMGNLPSDKPTPKEFAQRFVPYGNIVEIMLKSTFGFIQFDNAESCQAAIEGENQNMMGDVRLDLKISRERGAHSRADEPNDVRGYNHNKYSDEGDDQHSNDAKRDYNSANRYNSGGNRSGRGRGRGGWNDDRHDRSQRYDDRDRVRDRDRDRRTSRSSRSPPHGSGHSNDGRNHNRDSSGYDSRDGRDARSGKQESRGNARNWDSDRSHGGYVGKDSTRLARHHDSTKAPTPVIKPIPKRYGSAVPECQLIVIGEVHREFVSHVFSTLKRARIFTETLRMPAQMDLKQAVEQYQQEGVKAIVFLEKSREMSGKVALQVFSRHSGVVEYDNVTLDQTCDYIIRERHGHDPRASGANSFGNPTGHSSNYPSHNQQPYQEQQQLLSQINAGIGGNNTVATALAALVAQSQAQGTPLDPQVLFALANAAAASGAAGGAPPSIQGGGNNLGPSSTASGLFHPPATLVQNVGGSGMGGYGHQQMNMHAQQQNQYHHAQQQSGHAAGMYMQNAGEPVNQALHNGNGTGTMPQGYPHGSNMHQMSNPSHNIGGNARMGMMSQSGRSQHSLSHQAVSSNTGGNAPPTNIADMLSQLNASTRLLQAINNIKGPN
ncbi:hypothetical protein O5D80_001269 [Batrachochytrium dendrobatidis]|nr:hypothetical protein O5D80_001269 [Batrachochytrium dendrobatidis]